MLTALQPYDLKLLKTFLAVVDSGGFSAAQARLGRSLSAISSDVQTLETRLGVQLCRRGRSGFALTDYGRQVHEASRNLFDAVDRFQSEITLSREHLAGRLRISVNEGQVDDRNFVLSAALGRFTARPHNFVKISLFIVSLERTLEMIVNDEVDIGFGFFLTDQPRVKRVPLHQESNNLYCGRGHPLFSETEQSITLERVQSCPFVLRGPKIPHHYPRVLAGIKPAAIGMSPESRAYLILSGRYVGYLGDHQAEAWVRTGALRPLLPQVLQINATMQVATKEGTKRPAHIQAFLTDYFAAARERGVPVLSEFPEPAEATA